MRPSWPNSNGQALLRSLGLLLIAAAILKPLTGETSTTDYENITSVTRLVDWGLVVAELLLGVWLLTSVHLSLAKHLALCLFSVYLAISMGKVFRGEQTCGCFGSLTTPPMVVAGLDAAAVIALLASALKDGAWQCPRMRRIVHPGLALGLGIIIGTGSDYPLRFSSGGELQSARLGR